MSHDKEFAMMMNKTDPHVKGFLNAILTQIKDDLGLVLQD